MLLDRGANQILFDCCYYICPCLLSCPYFIPPTTNWLGCQQQSDQHTSLVSFAMTLSSSARASSTQGTFLVKGLGLVNMLGEGSE